MCFSPAFILYDNLHSLVDFQVEPIEIGGLYELTSDAKSRVSDSVIIHQGELVTVIKPGTNLYLIEAKSSQNENPRRCWVPYQWLVKADSSKGDVVKSLESELDAASIGELTLSEYSSSKSFPESGFSTELSRTSSALSSEGSTLTRKFRPL